MEYYPTIITYDIEKKEDAVHAFVKECMEKKNYFDAFIFTDLKGLKKIVHLPNTTLWNPNTNTSNAADSITDCLEQYEKITRKKHELEKCFINKFNTDRKYWEGLAWIATKDEIGKYPEI